MSDQINTAMANLQFTSNPIRFFGLPAELRNGIYEAALVRKEGVNPIADDKTDPDLSFLEISPRIRGESEHLCYTQNIFSFDLSYDEINAGAPLTSAWLHAVGHKRIRHVGGIKITHKFLDREVFTLELTHGVIDNKPALVLKDLKISTDQPWDTFATSLVQQWPQLANYGPRPLPYDDSPLRASISFALRHLYSNAEGIDLASYCGRNLVGGLAQFLLYCDTLHAWDFDPCIANALQFIMGSTLLVPFDLASARLDEIKRVQALQEQEGQ